MGQLVQHKVYAAKELLVIANEQIERLRQRLTKLIEQGKVDPERAAAIIGVLQARCEAAIAKVANVPIMNTNVPLLATIGMEHLTCSIQMTMVQLDEKTGTSYLNDGEITDEVDLPEGLAGWAIDVEDGQQHCTGETTAKDEEEIIKQQGRLRLIVSGAIALGIHTDVLKRHNVTASGSRFMGAGGVPHLYRGDGKPGLGYSSVVGHAGAEWGSASCSSYI